MKGVALGAVAGEVPGLLEALALELVLDVRGPERLLAQDGDRAAHGVPVDSLHVSPSCSRRMWS